MPRFCFLYRPNYRVSRFIFNVEIGICRNRKTKLPSPSIFLEIGWASLPSGLGVGLWPVCDRNLISKALFPELSRYNRRCQALSLTIKWIRHQLANRGPYHAYTVVHGLLIERCHFARMHRGIVDIGLLCLQKDCFLWIETSSAGH
jgi:hypothetical protein